MLEVNRAISLAAEVHPQGLSDPSRFTPDGLLLGKGLGEAGIRLGGGAADSRGAAPSPLARPPPASNAGFSAWLSARVEATAAPWLQGGLPTHRLGR